MPHAQQYPEQVCVNGPYTPDDLPEPARPHPRGTEGAGSRAVELLPPRDVPLGGPRAMRVRRTLPQRARSLVGGWCFVDLYGPDDLAVAAPMRVPRHPHTGLATVSWLFSGTIDHLDSAGNRATVEPGEVVLMNAGRGITHSEDSTPETTVLHGAQLWYAFPDAYRRTDPSLQRHRPAPVRGEGWEATVFLGSLLGTTSPVPTYLPLTGAQLRLEPGTVLELEVPADHEHGVLAVSGALSVDGDEVPADHLSFLGTGRRSFTVGAGDEPALALVLGGEPLGEQILMWWNFVGRTHEEIVAYRRAYQAEMGFEEPTGDPVEGPSDERQGDHRPGQQELRGREAPLFGEFPPGRPDPLPAPALPSTRLKPRG